MNSTNGHMAGIAAADCGNLGRIGNFDRMLLAGVLMFPKPAQSRRGRLTGALRRLVLFLAVVGLVILPSITFAAESIGAGLFVGGLSDRVIEQVVKPEIEPQERADRMRALLSESVATDTIARFVIGRYWRTATDDERLAFLEVFRNTMVFRFMNLLGRYAGERISVGRVDADPKYPDRFTVASRLVNPDARPIDIIWQVRRDRDAYKVLDVVAEGVSMVLTLRSEYSAFIRQQGGDVGALTQKLHDRLPAGMD